MTVHCLKSGCDRTWPRDPALEVACPACGAGIGQRCKRPSGHPIFKEPGGQPGVHAKRDVLADQAGHYGPCPSGRCGLKKPAPLPWEATPEGLQFVVPGCEKDPDKGPAQGALF